MRRRGGRRPQEKSDLPKINFNEGIRAKEVRLLDPEGELIGVVGIETALKHASDAELDLVEISPNASPPVCKIMDYRKFFFELKKKKNEAKKRQKQIVHKAIKFRPNTDVGDYTVKVKKIQEFIQKGNYVKVIIWFRGREMAHQELGRNLLERVYGDLESQAQLQSEAKMEGRQMMMVLAPLAAK